MRKIVCIIILLFSAVPLMANDIQSVTYTWIANNTNYDVDKSGYMNIGDKVKFTVTLVDLAPSTNIVTIDIGTLYENIQLFNPTADNTFTNMWTIPEGTSTFEAPVIGNFWECQTCPQKSFTCSTPITFDAQRPIINNISISPNAYNPYLGNCEIAYYLSETVNNVLVKLYNDLGKTPPAVRTLQKPPTEAGDNFITWWDGKNDAGNSVSEKDYYIDISCRDLSGNYSLGPMATVKLSSIKLDIVSLDLSPNPVSPDGDGTDDRLYINAKIMLYSWDGTYVDGNPKKRSISQQQMYNLGFTAGSNWPSASSYPTGTLLNYWPYALFGFTIWNASGTAKLLTIGPDVDPDEDSDIDFLSFFPSLASNYIPDDNKNNDYDILANLYDNGLPPNGSELPYGGTKQSNDGIFTAWKSFWVKLDGTWNDGSYIVKSGAELTSIDYTLEEGKVHFKPDYKGGYVSANPVQASFVVDNTGASGMDSIAPNVISVYPEPDSKVTYRVNLVSAFLEDNTGGSGVSLLDSDIYLSDELGNKVPGEKINNGVNVLSWELDTPLNISGNYTINVKPVDKRGNTPTDYLKYNFVLDVLGDTQNLITVTGGGTIYDGLGKLYLSVPPYAVEQDMRITVFKPIVSPGDQTAYGCAQFMPSNVDFKRPVNLTLYYKEKDKTSLPAGITEKSLRIYNWITDKWNYVGGNVNENNMSVTVSGIRSLDGFYGLLPETEGGKPTEIITDVQVDKPFKQNGYVSFKVSGSISSMKLLIYTLEGAFIKEVPINIANINNAGYYDLQWDGLSGTGHIVNNGIYIFRFIVERADGEKKIISKAIPMIK